MDNQFTPSMALCDLVLPDTTTAERWDLVPSEYTGDMAYLILCEQAIEPLYEARSSMDVTSASPLTAWASGMNLTLGMREQRDGARHLQEENRKVKPDFHLRRNAGTACLPLLQRRRTHCSTKVLPRRPLLQIRLILRPERSKFIRQASLRWLRNMGVSSTETGDFITPIPMHVDTGKGPPRRRRTPIIRCRLSATTTSHVRIQLTETTRILVRFIRSERGLTWIDANERGIANGDAMFVHNERGRIRIDAMVTPRIAPGIVSVPQGAWIDINGDGVDEGGAVNMLTSLHPTPLAKGNGQHTVLAQVEKA